MLRRHEPRDLTLHLFHQVASIAALTSVLIGVGAASSPASALEATAGQTAAAAATAAATGPDSCSQVYLGPQPTASGPSSYFSLTAAPGQTQKAQLVAANPSGETCEVELSPAYGQTATNSGNTYIERPRRSCPETACWVSGLPRTITIPARGRRLVPFTVKVPSTATSGNHLAGIIGRNAPTSGQGATRGVAMRIDTEVAIGVAVTVTGPADPHLTIPTVVMQAHQSAVAPGVAITEHNDGATWEHPAGTLTVDVPDPATGRTRTISVPVTSSTILPGDDASLLVATAGVPEGPHPVRVELWYAARHKVAIWEGILAFPPPIPVVKNGDVITVAPASQPADRSWLPKWLRKGLGPLLIAIAVGILLTIGALLFWFLIWKRRNREDDEEEADAAAAPQPSPYARHIAGNAASIPTQGVITQPGTENNGFDDLISNNLVGPGRHRV